MGVFLQISKFPKYPPPWTSLIYCKLVINRYKLVYFKLVLFQAIDRLLDYFVLFIGLKNEKLCFYPKYFIKIIVSFIIELKKYFRVLKFSSKNSLFIWNVDNLRNRR